MDFYSKTVPESIIIVLRYNTLVNTVKLCVYKYHLLYFQCSELSIEFWILYDDVNYINYLEQYNL